MKRRDVFSKLALSAAGILGVGALSACANGKLSLSTTDIDKDAQALAFLVNTVVASQVFSKASPSDQAQITAVVKNITATTAMIAEKSNGVISIDTSASWAKSLIGEMTQFLAIAEPVAAQYDTTVAKYLGLAKELLPFLQAIVDTASGTPAATPSAVAVRAMGTPLAEPHSIRAAIYRGPSA